MLSVLSHVEVVSLTGALPDWKAEAAELTEVDEVAAAAPFVSGQGLISGGRTGRASLVRGIDPARK